MRRNEEKEKNEWCGINYERINLVKQKEKATRIRAADRKHHSQPPITVVSLVVSICF